MRIRLAAAELVNSVFINVRANMAAGARRINMGILFTNRKLPTIQSESVPRSRSKASTYGHTEKNYQYQNCVFDKGCRYKHYLHKAHL